MTYKIKMYLKVFLTSVLLSAYSQMVAQSLKEHKAAIEEVIQEAYVDGLYNEGYLLSIEYSMADDFNQIGVNASEEVELKTLSAFLAELNEKKTKGEIPVDKYNEAKVKFLKIDISGRAAQVKLQFYEGGRPTHIDFLSLYRFKTGWKILNLMSTPNEPDTKNLEAIEE